MATISNKDPNQKVTCWVCQGTGKTSIAKKPCFWCLGVGSFSAEVAKSKRTIARFLANNVLWT